MQTLPKKIVCTVDFSNFTEFVIQNAIAFARRFNATLILLHTIYHPKDALYGTTDFEFSGERDKLKRTAADRMDQIMRMEAISWKPVILYGDPVEEIPIYSDNNNIDLVIAASHGISGVKRLFIGTVIERLARRLYQPFLVLKANRQKKNITCTALKHGSKMVICCDLKKESENLIQYGMAWARDIGYSVILLHAIETPINENEVDSTAGPYNEVQQTLLRKTKQKLLCMVPDRYVDIVPFEATVVTGEAKEKFPGILCELDAAIVLMGVRYHSLLGKILLGSTTEAILRYAKCSVITVHQS